MARNNCNEKQLTTKDVRSTCGQQREVMLVLIQKLAKVTVIMWENPYVAPGALLAIPKSLEKQVEVKTTIGKKIKDAFINYGGYIVDGTGPGSDGHNMVAICMDSLVNAEMRHQYKFNMAYPHGVTDGNPVYSDLLKIFRNLHAVSNNSPSSVGGGGVPLKPTKPPLCK